MSSVLNQSTFSLSHYRFGDTIYEKGSGRLFSLVEGQLKEITPLSLTHQAYLNYLIDKNHVIATFDELAQLEGKQVNNNTVSKHIGKIKLLLGYDIENIPRQGYKLPPNYSLVDLKHFQEQPQKAKKQPLALPKQTQKLSTSSPVKTKLPAVLAITMILFALMLSTWFVIAGDSQVDATLNHKVTMIQGSQHQSVLSPGGRLLAYEQQSSLGQLTNLWIKHLHSGQKMALTASIIGVEDELGAFSQDGLRLVFHRTTQRNSCSVHEIVFSQFNPIKYNEKQLFDCKPGYKTMNVEYGEDINTLFFTDYKTTDKSHDVYRYDRVSNQVSKIYSLDHLGQSLYRVYPLQSNKELLLLATTDWSSTVIYRLDLTTNVLQHLTYVPTVLPSITVDGINREFYYLNGSDLDDNELLFKFSLSTGPLGKIVYP